MKTVEKSKSAYKLVVGHFAKSLNEMFSQFDTNESMISIETQALLDDEKSKEKIFQIIMNKPQSGESTIEFEDGKKVTFYVEA